MGKLLFIAYTGSESQCYLTQMVKAQIDTIKSLNDFIHLLKTNDPSHYPRIVSKLQLDKSEMEPFAFFNPGEYTRNCIERTQDFELILICWDKQTKSPIHAHDEQCCWVFQVDGNVSEIRYKANENNDLEASHEMQLTPGCRTYMHDTMGYHALMNNTESHAMTLHLYASPIDSCKVLNTESGCFNEKELSYHSFKGELVANRVTR